MKKNTNFKIINEIKKQLVLNGRFSKEEEQKRKIWGIINYKKCIQLLKRNFKVIVKENGKKFLCSFFIFILSKCKRERREGIKLDNLIQERRRKRAIGIS